MFSNIRFIKMSGLENHFLSKIMEVKTDELYWMKMEYVNYAMFTVLLGVTPGLFLAAIFAGYIYFEGSLTVALIFTVIQIYEIFNWNFAHMPFIVIWILDLMVSGQRIVFFLLSENIDGGYIKNVGLEGAGALEEVDDAIVIENGCFYWEDKDLRRICEAEKARIAKNDVGQEIQEKVKRINERKAGKVVAEAARKERLASKAALDKKVDKKVVRKVYIRNGFGDEVDQLNKDTKTKGKGKKGDATRSVATIQAKTTRNTLLSDRGTETSGTQLGGDLGDPMLPLGSGDTYSGITFNLKNLNIKIPKGRCVAVIGKVGSGKSSLLSCLSGEMYHRAGAKIQLSGTTAYVSQKAWIPSDSVRN